MYKRMLVPLDGSELAEVVFTYAKEFAGRLNFEDVILLCVGNPVLREFIPMQQAYIERAADKIRRQSRAVQKRTGVQSGVKPVEARGELTVGHPADGILRYADENDVDLILMATHGRSGIRRWAMGSVADKVLRASKVPVLLVRAGIPDEIVYDQWPTRTILAPLDGSELDESVLTHVEALTKKRMPTFDQVVLLRVCEPPSLPSYSIPELSDIPLNWGQYEQQEIARSKRVAGEYLTGAEKRFKDSGISVRSEVLVGKANEEIVNYANKNPFNLIVMATHGRAGLSRWVYGSVAEYVLLGVTSPVLLIRPHSSNS
ncbi:universal stress protein [Chloroflexota bacterium]